MIELFSVIIGGVLATAGGAFTQWHLYKLKAYDDERSLRESKLSDLVMAIYEYDHWLDDFVNKRVFGEEIADRPDPFAKIFSTVHLYFPELETSQKVLQKTSSAFKYWACEKAQDRVSGAVDKLTDRHVEVYTPYNNAKKDFLNEIQNLTKLVSNK